MNKLDAIEWQRARALDNLKEARRTVARYEEVLTRLAAAERHARSEQTVNVDGPTMCPTCGEDVSTERLFSLHFTIPDPRYYNLGSCPHKGTARDRNA